MAGSIRDFKYLFDNGVSCAIRADESNTEAVNAAGGAAAATTGLIVLPITKYVRRIRYRSVDKLHSVTVPVLDPEEIPVLPASFVINKANGAGPTLNITVFKGKVLGERFVASTGLDSGLNDGDNP